MMTNLRPSNRFASGRACLIVLVCLCLPMSCVSKRRYAELEQSSQDCQKTSRQIITRKNQEITRLKQQLHTTQTEYRDLRDRHGDLIKVNQQLFEGIQNLNVELDKKKSVIDIQQQVIRLLDDTRNTIASSLDEQIAAVESAPTQIDSPEPVRFILVDKLLFESGSTVITAPGRKILKQIAATLERHRRGQIIVSGHTDDMPPGPELRDNYPTNWELSSARASAVVRFLLQHSRIDPGRMVVCGYGSYQPSAANDGPEGRQRNRRIEIYLAPDGYLPASVGPAGMDDAEP